MINGKSGASKTSAGQSGASTTTTGRAHAESEADPDLVRAKINGETGQIAWCDIQRFFASGHAIVVDPGLNLLDVACAFAEDDHEQVGVWLAAGTVGRVADEQALGWHTTNARMWSVVVKPWVLVQPVVPARAEDTSGSDR